MGRNRIIHMLLLGAIVCGCAKSDIDTPITSVGDSDEISFGISADWTTKGTSVNDISNIDELEVYTYFTDGVTWDGATSSDQLKGYFAPDANDPVILAVADDGSCTYSGGLRYWPTGDNQYLSFITVYSAEDNDVQLTRTVDEITGKPKFSFTQQYFADGNDDLLAKTLFDQQSSSNGGVVNLDLQHLLTKLSLSASYTDSRDYDAYVHESNDNEIAALDEYYINGVTFYNLYQNADLSISTTDGITWTIDDSSSITHTATQGVTLKSADDTASQLTTTSTSMMLDDSHSIFVLPQTLGSARNSSALASASDVTTAPTVEIRIRRKYYASEADCTAGTFTEKIYESQQIVVPIPTGNDEGFEMGQHINLVFSFDLADLEHLNTPLSLESEIFGWTEADVSIDIHNNLYIYSSDSNVVVDGVAGDYYGEFELYTNYDYNLRVPHQRVELDGDITSSRGILFCSDLFGSVTTNDAGTVDGFDDYKIFVPTLLSKQDGDEVKYATKTSLNYQEEKTTDPETGEETVVPFTYEVTYQTTDANGTQSGVYETKEVEISFGQNDYAFMLNEETGNYRLLYHDSDSNAAKAFDYVNDPTTGYHEIDLTDYEDDSTVYFVVSITDSYEFNFSVKRSTRDVEGLYTNSSVNNSNNEDDYSYGVNKSGDDAVYILRLSVDTSHFSSTTESDVLLQGVVGAEMISNGGGMVTNLFKVELRDTDGLITD